MYFNVAGISFYSKKLDIEMGTISKLPASLLISKKNHILYYYNLRVPLYNGVEIEIEWMNECK